MFEAAAARGKRYQFYSDAGEQGQIAAVVVAEYDQSGDGAKKKIAKKIAKAFENESAYIALERTPEKIGDLQVLLQATSLMQLSDKPELSAPPITEGAYIPPEHLGEFAKAVSEIEKKLHLDLPLCGHAGEHIYYTRPLLNFSKVADRQKVFKLLAEWSVAVNTHGGVLIGADGKGRLKAAFAYRDLEDDVKDLYKAVRELFDPMSIMNVGVKQAVELKKLAESMRSDYDGTDFARFGAIE